MKGKALVCLMILSVIAVFLGCAESRIYLVDLSYIAEEKAPPT